jgi:hypothetical protein
MSKIIIVKIPANEKFQEFTSMIIKSIPYRIPKPTHNSLSSLFFPALIKTTKKWITFDKWKLEDIFLENGLPSWVIDYFKYKKKAPVFCCWLCGDKYYYRPKPYGLCQYCWESQCDDNLVSYHPSNQLNVDLLWEDSFVEQLTEEEAKEEHCFTAWKRLVLPILKNIETQEEANELGFGKIWKPKYAKKKGKK